MNERTMVVGGRRSGKTAEFVAALEARIAELEGQNRSLKRALNAHVDLRAELERERELADALALALWVISPHSPALGRFRTARREDS